MISKIFLSFCFVLFVSLNLNECTPHRRHHNYHHNYHVNYSPYTLPKRGPYFGVESPTFNDLEDHISNEPVKGGIKNTAQTQIKTPMKLFSERKNGYLTGSFSSLQDKFNEAKRVNPSSIKQQSSDSSSIIYPNEPASSNEDFDSSSLPDLNKKKVDSASKKGSSSSKINAKSKISTTTTVIPESSTAVPQKPIKIEVTENHIKDAPVVSSSESNVDVKTNRLDTKLSSSTTSLPSTSSTTEQSATTVSDLSLSPSSSSHVNVEANLDIKEIKVDISDTVKSDTVKSDTVKSDSSNVAVKVDSSKVSSVNVVDVVESNVPKSQSDPVKVVENVVTKIDKPENKPEIEVKKTENSLPDLVKVDSVTNPQIVADVKPIIIESSIQNSETGTANAVSEVDVKKKQDKIEEKPMGDVNVISSNPKDIVVNSNIVSNVEEIVPKTDLNAKIVSSQVESAIKQPSSSVDIVPPIVSLNTESSLVLENETNSPLIN